MRIGRWFLLIGALTGCDSASTLPLDVEVKDSVEIPGGKWDDIRVIVKSLPGAEVGVDQQTKSMDATQANEQFAIPKSSLKLGKNTFVAHAKAGALFSKKEAEKTVSWDAQPRSLLRFSGGSKGDAEALSCSGPMCGDTALKATKAGHLPLEIAAAIAGTVTVAGVKAEIAASHRATIEVDLLPLLAGRSAGELTQIALPVSFEANGVKADDVLELGGAPLSDLVARIFSQVEQGPVVFAGDKPAADAKRSLLLVVGAPAHNLIPVGAQGKFADVDLVGVAKKSERAFACPNDSEILYNDLDIRVVDRRTAKVVGTKKLLADRVSCPPTPTGKLTGDVREDDIRRVLGEYVTR